jgi:hypothetical protein
MTTFPLYDTLIKDINFKKDLSIEQKEEFIEKVEHIDDKGRDLIYALIQFHNIINKDESITSGVPYSGNIENVGKNSENISWVFTDLPIKLRHILYKFITIHMETLKETNSRPV